MNCSAYAKSTECHPFSCITTVTGTSGVAKLRIDRHIQATGICAELYPVGCEPNFALSIFDAPPKIGEQVRLEWTPSTNWRAIRIESSDNPPTE